MGLRLTRTVAAWGTDDFVVALKSELQTADIRQLPLQQALTRSSRVSDAAISVVILRANAGETAILVKVGIFYTGMVAGCSCADDPTPNDEINEYCELELLIDRETAVTRITLLGDS